MNEKFVHIDVFVDITDPEQITALSTFLTKVGKNTQALEAQAESQPKPEPEPESQSQTGEPAKPAKPSKPVKTPKSQPEPQPEPQPESEKPADGERTYQIEEVREKLKVKVSEHREEIKAKLTELGAPNVSSLDPSKYSEFVNFLEGLE